MDIQLCYPLLAAFFLLITAILTLRKQSKSSRSTLNLPPGPWKLPLVGNLHNMVRALPHHALRDLAMKYGPLMHLRLGEVSTVVCSSAEVAREVMKTHDITFASRPPVLASKILLYDSMDIVYAPYGEYWRQLRKICTLELLSTNRVRSFWRIREEEVSDLVERITSNVESPVNLTENLFSLAYSITARATFGKKCRSQEQFISLVAETTKHIAGFDVIDIFPSLTWLHVISGMKPRLKKMHSEIDGILDNIFKEHLEARSYKMDDSDETVDLIDVLLKFDKSSDHEFALSTINIKAVIFDMFAAGSETSATVVDWAMAEMMKRPKILEKAQAEVRQVFDRQGKVVEKDLPELKLLNSVIKETLRLHPAIPLILRECGARCKIKEFEIPEKTKVIVNVWAIGRDPEYWNELETFDPERFLESAVDYKGKNFEYIPFGAGRRICPGITFGLVNVKFQLAMLLYHFDWKLPTGMENGDLDMTESFGLSIRRKDDMYLIPARYCPSQSTLQK